MGKGDRCAIYGCKNDRRFKDKYVIKPHISSFDGSSKLRFWKCRNANHYKTWTKLLSWQNYTVNANTRICSNHFKFGRPTDVDPHPTLYLRGYSEQVGIKRKPPADRSVFASVVNCATQKRAKLTVTEITETKTRNENKSSSMANKENCKYKTVGCQVSSECEEMKYLKEQIESLKEQIRIKDLQTRTTFTFDSIKQSDALVKLYTGCPSSEMFYFIVDKVKPHSSKLQYYRGQISHESKKYQQSPTIPGCQTKPGPKRRVTLENEILMTLMRIRLDLKIDDLAFRFGISSSHASNTVSTMISFLSRELEPLIYWPTAEQTLAYNSKHFSGNLANVEGIIDCTEQKISKPSLSKAQYQTYSTYKSSNTLKKLVICTKSGSLSYISPSFGGSASDRFITEQCHTCREI